MGLQGRKQIIIVIILDAGWPHLLAIQFQNEQIIEWVAIICGKLHNKEAILVDVLLILLMVLLENHQTKYI